MVYPAMLAQSAQDQDLSADDIIEILQQNPDVLAAAKGEIVAQLRDRGYPVSDRSITDDRLFIAIRSEPRFRHALRVVLTQRGSGVHPQPPASASPPSPPSHRRDDVPR